MMAELMLNDHEVEILELIGRGYKNSHIARIFSVRNREITNVLINVFRKTKARTRTHAFAIAVKAGFIDINNIAV